MKNFTFCLLLLIGYSVQAQVGIGIPNPDASAVLELASKQKGFLPPRLTTVERDAINQPAQGLTIFNTTKNCLEWYNISGWYNACGDNGVATVTNYDCSTLATGTMTAGDPVSGVSQTITAKVSVPGSYDISAVENGVTFSASGNFTSVGDHQVVLHATGTPIAIGNHNFTLNTSPNSCSFTRTTNTGASIVSQYNCNTASAGTMTEGVAIAGGVTQTITATVTKTGTYNIKATANGVIFSSMGVFSATGTQTVVLTAVGTPTVAGNHNFTLNTSPNTCTFNRTTVTTITTVIGAAGETWMAYNLGATAPATSMTDTAQYGDYYQWGRDTDGHEKFNSPFITTQATTPFPGHGNFIFPTGLRKSWISPDNTNLWQGVNGINNPCPTGFRVPTAIEWQNEFIKGNMRNTTAAFNSVLKLPTPGFRNSFNSYAGRGSEGHYWTSSTNSNFGRRPKVEFTNLSGSTLAEQPAHGLSVRCIKD
ncbi:fibrobacter succinogenes major paralogous domain-containing protein [Flavobacterium hercynium]|uniref:Uncharacterized protein n=1 Tax=Flavobacterium hercynium TaxID=387094 RepID=A0A226GUS7_9FLAO|nr:FISUMP domain-containing protein [Flavobacterium hercynium]OXA85308.1 hypothetical protein B0A66_19900 [Flavobacterium hercynium]SMP29880.1 major paralogous domain-containing protein [Flavobacterium hercynium]